jgi:hypothetical protein
MPPKKRKEKTDILFSFMTLLLAAGQKGIIANSSFARQYNWSAAGLHNIVNTLCESGIAICTTGGHNKLVTVRQDITTHSDWLLEYYGEKVPPRLAPYLDVDAKPETNKTEGSVGESNILLDIKSLLDEKDTLMQLVASLKEAVMVRDTIIADYRERLDKINGLSNRKE